MVTVQRGFSMMELMAVVSIIGILAAGGIPSYQHFMKKARFSELIKAAMPFKTGVELCYQSSGGLNDCDSGKMHVPPAIESGKLAGLVDTVHVTNGKITVTPKKEHGLNKKDTFELVPSIKNQNITWQRRGGAVDAGYVS